MSIPFTNQTTEHQTPRNQSRRCDISGRSQSNTNPHLTDIECVFSDVETSGKKITLRGEPRIPNMAESHVQGICENDAYYVLTHNNKGYAKGHVLVISKDDLKLVNKADVDVNHYNHPGGCQRIGDYMVTGIENSDSNQSGIYLWSIAGDLGKLGPQIVATLADRPGTGCGAAGIADFLLDGVQQWALAGLNDGSVDIYRSSGGSLGDNSCTFSFSFTAKLRDEDKDAQSINLVTNDANFVYLVAFVSHGINYADHAVLYKVHLGDETFEFIKDLHVTTHHGGVIGVDGVHFRWGAGLTIDDSSSLNFLATQRNFVADRCTINRFKQGK